MNAGQASLHIEAGVRQQGDAEHALATHVAALLRGDLVGAALAQSAVATGQQHSISV
jgi:hypothetical protein